MFENGTGCILALMAKAIIAMLVFKRMPPILILHFVILFLSQQCARDAKRQKNCGHKLFLRHTYATKVRKIAFATYVPRCKYCPHPFYCPKTCRKTFQAVRKFSTLFVFVYMHKKLSGCTKTSHLTKHKNHSWLHLQQYRCNWKQLKQLTQFLYSMGDRDGGGASK